MGSAARSCLLPAVALWAIASPLLVSVMPGVGALAIAGSVGTTPVAGLEFLRLIFWFKLNGHVESAA